MFLPPKSRPAFLKKVFSAMESGGVVVIVDKVELPMGYPGSVLHGLTLAGKLAARVEPSEIIAKELSLIGVQRPLSQEELPNQAIELLRFGEFAGWIIEA
jgi:tRNA (cmo5U34)-methyltransferase